MSRIFVLAALALLSVASAKCRECYTGCRFQFCPPRCDIYLGHPNRALTPPICYRGTQIHVRVGIVGGTGEARLVWGKYWFIKISHWTPAGLLVPFSRSFFKAYAIKNWFGARYKYSGVGHETFQRSQRYFLDKKCFILPIQEWQEIGRDGNVVANRRSRNWKRDCVAFRTRV